MRSLLLGAALALTVTAASAEDQARAVNVYQPIYHDEASCQRDWGTMLQYLCVKSGDGYEGPRFFFALTSKGTIPMTTQGASAQPGNSLDPADARFHQPVGAGWAIGAQFYQQEPKPYVDKEAVAQSQEHAVLVAEAGGVKLWRVYDHFRYQKAYFLTAADDDGDVTYPVGRNAPVLLGEADGIKFFSVRDDYETLYFSTNLTRFHIKHCGRHCRSVHIVEGVQP